MAVDSFEKIKNIALLAMDFDGVHTDGFVYVDQNGIETVRCSRKDSLGLNMLKCAGIKLFVISKEENSVVAARCKKLNIECFHGVHDAFGKLEILKSLAEREGVAMEQIAFIGDDVNDVEALVSAGVGVTVADGHEEVKKVADIVLTRKGGDHALRELCDIVLNAKNVPIYY